MSEETEAQKKVTDFPEPLPWCAVSRGWVLTAGVGQGSEESSLIQNGRSSGPAVTECVR